MRIRALSPAVEVNCSSERGDAGIEKMEREIKIEHVTWRKHRGKELSFSSSGVANNAKGNERKRAHKIPKFSCFYEGRD